MRKILAVAVLAVFATVLTAQPKVDTVKEGKFKAKFPTDPVGLTKTAGGRTLNIYLADFDKGKGGYVVIYTDLPAEVVKAPKAEQVLESGEKGLKDIFKADIKESKAVTLEFGTKKYPAREIMAEKTDLTGEWNLRGKIVLANNRLYQVYVYGPKDFIMGDNAKAFLGSFEIVD